jgi:colicin import membrane protein
MSAAAEEIAKVEQAYRDLKKEAADRGMFSRAVGFFTGANIREEGAINEARNRIAVQRAQRRNSVNRLPFLQMGNKEAEAFARQLQNAAAMGQAALENALQGADDDARVKLLEAEAARLGEVARKAGAVRDAYEKFDRSEGKFKADTRLSDANLGVDFAKNDLKSLGLDVDAADATDVSALQRARAEQEELRRIREDVIAGRESSSSERGRRWTDRKDDAMNPAENVKALDAAIAAAVEQKAAEEAIAAVRRQSTSELVKVDQAVADIQAKGREMTDADRERLALLQKQRIALVQQKDQADQLAQSAQQRRMELEQAQRERAVGAVGRGFDQQILDATARGAGSSEIERLKREKEIATLREQASQEESRVAREATRLREQAAEADKNNEAGRAAALRAQADALGESTKAADLRRQADQIEKDKRLADAKFARDRGVDRQANAARIRGDFKGARAIEDAKALDDMISDYEANGMTEDQARKDFQAAILAQAAGKMPGTVADSKAAIGGGGGAFSGQDPVVAAQERVRLAVEAHTNIQKDNTNILKDIRDYLRPED